MRELLEALARELPAYRDRYALEGIPREEFFSPLSSTALRGPRSEPEA